MEMYTGYKKSLLHEIFLAWLFKKAFIRKKIMAFFVLKEYERNIMAGKVKRYKDDNTEDSVWDRLKAKWDKIGQWILKWNRNMIWHILFLGQKKKLRKNMWQSLDNFLEYPVSTYNNKNAHMCNSASSNLGFHAFLILK